MHRLVFAFLLALVAFAALGTGEEPKAQAAPDFARDVQPILAKHCVECHGPGKQRGGLRLDRKADALKGGDSGKAIVPSKPAESLLLKKVTSKDAKERMPFGKSALSAEQIKTLTAWIEAGANWPDAGLAPGKHWSFEPVSRPKLPDAKHTNPIDAFVAAKLSDSGLSLSPEADRRTLIRRLKFDLLGLPPTPEEVEAFVADKDANAYEKLVDKYLASPHYGERWARHWLDAVRFAESHGFEMNQPRPSAYHYRDYVIKAFNDDKPYDQFVREQLAGDSLGADVATAFLVAGPSDQVKSPDAVLTANQRADELHDMIGTTGSTFLGLTVACSRCHAHKFDPIPQLDYYQLKAVFAGVQHGERTVRTSDEASRKLAAEKLQAELADIESKLAAMEPLADSAATEARRFAVNPRGNTERFKPTKAKFVRFVIFESSSAEPCIDELEVFTSGPKPTNVALASAGAKATSSGNYPGSPDIHRLEFIHDGKYGNGRSWISNKPGRGWVAIEFADAVTIDRIVWARDREGKFTDRLATRYRIDVSLDRESWSVVASSDDRLAASGSANPTPAEPARDPDIGYPPGRAQPRPDEQLPLGMIGLSEGFPMSMRDGLASATRMRFVASWHEYWRSWCVLQSPVLSGQTDSSGTELYSCLPWGDWRDDGQCTVAIPSGVDGGVEHRPADCDKVLLCDRRVCVCNETSCTDSPDADFTFDLRITGRDAAGSVQIGANSGEFHNVYLTQSK